MDKVEDIVLLYETSKNRIDDTIANVESLEYNCRYIFSEEIHNIVTDVLPKLYTLKSKIDADVEYFNEVVVKETEYFSESKNN